MLTGYVAGPKDTEGGSGSNLLCVPARPEWQTSGGSPADDVDQVRGELVGAMYSRDVHNLFSLENNGNAELFKHLATCVVCHVTRRSSVLMIPAMTQCPNGWAMEYSGVLMSSPNDSRRGLPGMVLHRLKRSSYECWDGAPEGIAVPGPRSVNTATVLPVEVICGTLPCDSYASGQDVNCVVCSK